MRAASAAGDSSLHWAAFRGDLRAAQALLEAGAELDAAGECGNRPLHLAAAAKHHKAGGLGRSAARFQRRFLELLRRSAAAAAEPCPCRPARPLQMVALLLSYGADLYCRNHYGHLPVGLAAGDSKCRQLLERVARDGEAARLKLSEDLQQEAAAAAARAAAEEEAERQRWGALDAGRAGRAGRASSWPVGAAGAAGASLPMIGPRVPPPRREEERVARAAAAEARRVAEDEAVDAAEREAEARLRALEAAERAAEEARLQVGGAGVRRRALRRRLDAALRAGAVHAAAKACCSGCRPRRRRRPGWRRRPGRRQGRPRSPRQLRPRRSEGALSRRGLISSACRLLAAG